MRQSSDPIGMTSRCSAPPSVGLYRRSFFGVSDLGVGERRDGPGHVGGMYFWEAPKRAEECLRKVDRLLANLGITDMKKPPSR